MITQHPAVFLSIVCASLSLGSTALASPLFELVGGTTGSGGHNARATGPDAASTYFNPGLLPHARQGFGLGVLMLSDQISLTLDGRPGGHVPVALGEDRNVRDGDGRLIANDTIPTDWLEEGCNTGGCDPPFAPRPRQGRGSSGNTRAYTAIGLVSRIIDDKLVLGLHALVPIGEFTTAQQFHVDHREQFFSNSLHPELYSDRLTATSLAFGAGSQLFESLSVGVSFTINLQNTAAAGTYVRDSADYTQLELATDVQVNAGISPHFGLVFTPNDDIGLSLTAHSPQKLEIVTRFSAALPNGSESDTTRTAVHAYVPWIFGLGGDIALTDNFSAVATIGYALWSQYEDRQGNVPGDFYGEDYAWVDRPWVTLGARYNLPDPGFGAFFDLGYHPTPVPEQLGQSNYTDNDRISASLGGDLTFDVGGMTLRAGLQGQLHHLVARSVTKDDAQIHDEVPDNAVNGSTLEPLAGREGLQSNNPGWPGFSSEGWIFGGSVSLTLLY